jgi:hypothetical protein
MPLLKRRTILAAKQETTMGTAVSLAAADAGFNVMNISVDFDIPSSDRQAQGSMSRITSVPGARTGKVSFEIELSGSGSSGTPTPTWATTFLPACGWAVTTNVFSPVSDVASMKTLTIGVYHDGLLKQIKGAMGTFTLSAEAGKQATIKFEFTGCYGGVSDVALIAPTYPTVIPPRWATSTVTIGSYSPAPCSKLSIGANTTVHLREDPTDVTGYRAALVTDRYVKGSIDPETPLVATKDLWGDWLAGTEAAFSCSFGATAGNIVTLGAPKTQYTGINSGDRDGVLTEDVSFQCNKSANAGNDEFTITFS